jgi:hypothetical protein
MNLVGWSFMGTGSGNILGTGSMVVTDVLQWRWHHCPIISGGRHSIFDLSVDSSSGVLFFSTLRLINDTTMCAVDGHLFFVPLWLVI